MKQKNKLALFLASVAILVSASLYAGRYAYHDCNKCHLIFDTNNNSTNILTGLYKPFPAGIKP